MNPTTESVNPVLPCSPTSTTPPSATTATTSSTETTSPAPLWRLEAKNLFCTWAQNTTSKDTVLQRALEFFGARMRFAVIAEEAHANGDPHLHALFALNQRYLSRNPKDLDSLAGKHGDYRAARSLSKVMKYVTKSDPNPISHGVNVEEFLRSSSQGKSTFAAIAKDCMDGRTLIQINELYPGMVLQHKRKIEEYLTWYSVQKRRLETQQLQWTSVSASSGTAAARIATWLNQNIRTTREFKQPQLWIFGPPNTGKTTLLNGLRQRLNIFDVPIDEDFYDEFYDNMYDLAVIDEFKGQKKIQWLNRFLDGSHMTIRVKGSQRLKTQNIPVIICSNFEPSQCFHNVAQNQNEDRLAPLYARIEVVQVFEPEFITINHQ